MFNEFIILKDSLDSYKKDIKWYSLIKKNKFKKTLNDIHNTIDNLKNPMPYNLLIQFCSFLHSVGQTYENKKYSVKEFEPSPTMDMLYHFIITFTNEDNDSVVLSLKVFTDKVEIERTIIVNGEFEFRANEEYEKKDNIPYDPFGKTLLDFVYDYTSDYIFEDLNDG